MGRAPCCDKANVKKGPWAPEEDAKLKEYIEKHGTGGNWISLPQKAGLKRCGKSCRLRWLNYLRPNIKHGDFSDDEDRIICTLYANIGSRWSIIAAQLPGRTDNDIKNYWNTKLKKKLMGIIIHNHNNHPVSSRKLPHHLITTTSFSSLLQPNSSLPSSPSTALSSSSSSSPYTLARSFSSDQPLFPFSSPLGNNNNIPANMLQTQESLFGGMQNYSQVKESSLLMFGGEASCSSSDGSHGGASNNEEMGFQSYLYNGVEESQKLLLPGGGGGGGGWWEKQNGLWGGNANTIMDYGLEEIKQLISSGSSSICNNFLFEENKTEERVMYYY
ncbi:hypothetical protein JCGZ_16555 [Jatropha curcas]|uniref:MYB family protein n=1 Tax=Jatropha curcas TaxID=180498 RepID=A0A067JYX0_JATCU|nr:transcription factor RAX2 [Jatropha curcas]AIT52295.1 MYB family protein [Jatropha curcas]KDP29166.1 hypothetical protein JCGZ_16555 [Jatropha curcas]